MWHHWLTQQTPAPTAPLPQPPSAQLQVFCSHILSSTTWPAITLPTILISMYNHTCPSTVPARDQQRGIIHYLRYSFTINHYTLVEHISVHI